MNTNKNVHFCRVLCTILFIFPAQNNNNNLQMAGIATTAMRPAGTVVTTTITTIVSQNPCQTVITSTSYSTNSLKAAPTQSVASTKVGTSSFINLTTCNPQYLRSMQSSSYHRRHSVSGTVRPITTTTNHTT